MLKTRKGISILLSITTSIFLLPPSLLAYHDYTLRRLWGSRPSTTFSNIHDPRQSSSRVFEEILEKSPVSLHDYSTRELPPRFIGMRQSDWFLVQNNDDSIQDHSLRIIIIGGPASGKGTQCEHIASRYGVVHLSTGDMLREAVKEGSPTGQIAKGYMDRGELVPDEVMIKIVSERINQADCLERGWLLDGFPRTKAQAEHFARMGVEEDITIYLDVSDEELVERVVGRRMDPVTGKIYHLKFRPPPPEILHRLEQRSDDTIVKIRRRLEQFHENVSQIRSYLNDSIVQIDGSGAPEKIAKQIAKSIDQRVKSKVKC